MYEQEADFSWPTCRTSAFQSMHKFKVSNIASDDIAMKLFPYRSNNVDKLLHTKECFLSSRRSSEGIRFLHCWKTTISLSPKIINSTSDLWLVYLGSPKGFCKYCAMFFAFLACRVVGKNRQLAALVIELLCYFNKLTAPMATHKNSRGWKNTNQ